LDADFLKGIQRWRRGAPPSMQASIFDGEGLMSEETIKESVIAGSWYSDQPDVLKDDVEGYLVRAKTADLGGELIGLIVPHAGYAYSGGVAAYAYRMLQDRPFARVLILAPSHRAHFRGSSMYPLGGYRTPLGVVSLDREIVEAFRGRPSLIGYHPEAESGEHSLEIQLPFLQVLSRDFLLTPIVMGDQSLDYCRRLAEAIAEICTDKGVLLIASSDLSHFHPYGEARRMDEVVMARVAEYDVEGLANALRKGECEACGGGPMLAAMLAARAMGANKSKVLHYANSGDVTGDERSVVGYMAAALYANPSKAGGAFVRGSGKAGIDLGLTGEEKETLRSIALAAIRCKCLGEAMPVLPLMSPRLEERRGAFVCLHKGRDLRGCIGMIEGLKPLHETVKEMAVQAAFGDPRFSALARDELDEIDIEISVLTPLERIDDPSQIAIGKHGLYIRKKRSSGLLLPQVATEQGWDRIQFLEWTCHKAGLPRKAWTDADAEIYVFSADIF